MAYDPKCHELAVWFIADYPALVSPENVERLAQLIQDAVESELEWLEMERQERMKAE